MGDFQDRYEISAVDRVGKGVTGLPDTPGLSTGDMQTRFDSLGNLSIDKFNAFIECVGDAIENSGIKVPTMKAIVAYVSALGGGDMLKAVYDTNDDGVVDNSEALDGHGASYYRLIGDNAGGHNSVYRGKYLGTSVTAAQYAAISAGTFDDLFIGDYWTINGVNWRIAHFDYWLGTGDEECTTHHVVIVPDTVLYTKPMNATNVTTGGYYSSAMRGGALYPSGGNLADAKTAVDGAFGASHILSHKVLVTNTVTSGNATSWGWNASTVDLMSEVMVYGTLAHSVGGKGYEVGVDTEQLALFRLNHTFVAIRSQWWLRGVASTSEFTAVAVEGHSRMTNAGFVVGVRPAFAIKA